jgi:poly(hydroxyalkanoate) depolymerase family esterase
MKITSSAWFRRARLVTVAAATLASAVACGSSDDGSASSEQGLGGQPTDCNPLLWWTCFDGGSSGSSGTGIDSGSPTSGDLTPVANFGTNPGNLQMFTYVPKNAGPKAPLVVAMHGCTQTASDFETIGWNKLADRLGFYVVYPQQTSKNNPEECFNWAGEYGDLTDITRDKGEALSVKQMVDTMKSTHSIDNSRVFVTGFSAGGGFAVVMLALYPDVFAAGASYSGLPFKCATDLQGAYSCQNSGNTKSPQEWGDLVRSADPGYAGPYPRISIWQGSSDSTVNTKNFDELVKQWTDVAGLSQTPSSSNTVAGFPHNEYKDQNGVVRIESYKISGMAHDVAVDPSGGCGATGSYAVDEKICAVDYTAKFFGLE